MATQRYWGAEYWHDDRAASPLGGYYWGDEYWPAITPGGDDRTGQIDATAQLIAAAAGDEYWSETYFSTTYFSVSYFGGGVQGAAFRGTFAVTGQVTGSIATTLDDFTSNITGPVVQAQIFDISLDIGVPWTSVEYPGFAGTFPAQVGSPLAPPALDDFGIESQFVPGAPWVGTFVASGGFTGTIAVTLEDAPANFDGTLVAPPNVAGSITTILGPHQGAFAGSFNPPGSAIGTISVTLEDLPTDFDGTMAPGTKTGDIAVTLGDYTSAITGFFAFESVHQGPLVSILDGATGAFTGTNESNPVVTPPERTYVVAAQSRVYTVSGQNRTYIR